MQVDQVVRALIRRAESWARTIEKARGTNLNEERLGPYALQHDGALVIARPLIEAFRGIQDTWQEVDVADRVEEHAGPPEHPPHREVDVVLGLEWLVPGGPRVLASEPGPQCDRLDRLHPDPARGARFEQGLEILGIVGPVHRHQVVAHPPPINIPTPQPP